MEQLGELRPGDGGGGSQPLGTALDIARSHHGPDRGQRPVRHLAGIGKAGQVGVFIFLRTQLEGPCQDGEHLLAGDGVLRGHGVGPGALVGAHVAGHGDLVIVPGVFGHVGELGDIPLYVCSEGPVHHGGHLRPGEVSFGQEQVLVCAFQQAVVHRRGHGLGVPGGGFKVREVRRRLGARGAGGAHQAQDQN